MAEHQPARRLFVLDTNVLIHDPSSLYRFQEHDIFLPMQVLEELDRVKKGESEIAVSVRQVSRFLAELLSGARQLEIDAGLPLQSSDSDGLPGGRLFFQTRALGGKLPAGLPGDNPDNEILAVAIALPTAYPDHEIVVVSKDINLRIKAAVLGIDAQDYHNDQVLDDVTLLFRGLTPLPANALPNEPSEAARAGSSPVHVQGAWVESLLPNQGLYRSVGGGHQMWLVRKLNGNQAVLEELADFVNPRDTVWGVRARNLEQNFALNLLLDPAIDFVSLVGPAGTGKTLLALAAGLDQVLDQRRFREIIMTRATVSVGDDIGFLPGTEEEKMTPWMGALIDNLEVLTEGGEGGSWGRGATQELLNKRIKIRSLNFMRGRTFQNKFLIIDEAQNLSAKQMKTLITRAGPGTKVVVLGNISQIDTPYLSETTSGLTYAIDRFKSWQGSGHVTLTRGERSALAEFASQHL